jgi:hypothetical protein
MYAARKAEQYGLNNHKTNPPGHLNPIKLIMAGLASNIMEILSGTQNCTVRKCSHLTRQRF